ncbi:MAG: hypothetical protein WD972_00775 [Candidatus Andersenbacteria bacterium]
MRYTWPLLVSAALLLLPLAFWAERFDMTIWQDRLILPNFIEEPHRHTPRQTSGTWLPPVITKSQTFSAEQSPLIVSGITRIPAGVTLTLAAGTTVAFAEFAHLDIKGTLVSSGSEQAPVRLISNELHPSNQLWGGLIFSDTARGELSHTEIEQAAPAVSCLNASQVTVRWSRIHLGSMGILVTSPHCVIDQSVISAARDGIVSIGATPVVTATSIMAPQPATQH